MRSDLQIWPCDLHLRPLKAILWTYRVLVLVICKFDTDTSQNVSTNLTVRSFPVSSPGNRGSFMMSQAWNVRKSSGQKSDGLGHDAHADQAWAASRKASEGETGSHRIHQDSRLIPIQSPGHCVVAHDDAPHVCLDSCPVH